MLTMVLQFELGFLKSIDLEVDMIKYSFVAFTDEITTTTVAVVAVVTDNITTTIAIAVDFQQMTMLWFMVK